MVALGVLGNLLDGLAGGIGKNLIEIAPRLLDLLRHNLDLGLLPLGAAARLVDHHHRVRQAEALALRTVREQHRSHRGGHAHADGGHIGLDEVHRVENRKTGVDLASRRVDVERDILLGILALQMQQLRDNQVRGHRVDLLAQKDDAVVQQARIDVVAALAARRLLDDVGNQRRINTR